uniref:Uncharacterized protein n=1 Tax=Mycena chlorophos TaxID=658473 RepID=A0ABQ0LFU9_MYCCL|nr:predicted protein [Mycena chlorophos]
MPNSTDAVFRIHTRSGHRNGTPHAIPVSNHRHFHARTKSVQSGDHTHQSQHGTTPACTSSSSTPATET